MNVMGAPKGWGRTRRMHGQGSKRNQIQKSVQIFGLGHDYFDRIFDDCYGSPDGGGGIHFGTIMNRSTSACGKKKRELETVW